MSNVYALTVRFFPDTWWLRETSPRVRWSSSSLPLPSAPLRWANPSAWDVTIGSGSLSTRALSAASPCAARSARPSASTRTTSAGPCRKRGSGNWLSPSFGPTTAIEKKNIVLLFVQGRRLQVQLQLLRGRARLPERVRPSRLLHSGSRPRPLESGLESHVSPGQEKSVQVLEREDRQSHSTNQGVL